MCSTSFIPRALSVEVPEEGLTMSRSSLAGTLRTVNRFWVKKFALPNRKPGRVPSSSNEYYTLIGLSTIARPQIKKRVNYDAAGHPKYNGYENIENVYIKVSRGLRMNLHQTQKHSTTALLSTFPITVSHQHGSFRQRPHPRRSRCKRQSNRHAILSCLAWPGCRERLVTLTSCIEIFLCGRRHTNIYRM